MLWHSVLTIFLVVFLTQSLAHATISCPPYPVQTEWKFGADVEIPIKTLQKFIGSADLKAHVEVTAQNLRARYQEKTYLAHLMVAMFCQMLNDSKGFDDEKKFTLFQEIRESIFQIFSEQAKPAQATVARPQTPVEKPSTERPSFNARNVEFNRDQAYKDCIDRIGPSQEEIKEDKSADKSQDKDALVIVTGPLTGTFFRFGTDIKKIAQRFGMKVIAKVSDGASKNIVRVVSPENASLGITHLNVLIESGPEYYTKAKNLRLFLPLYPQEVHILANKDIKDIKLLQGKRVHLGSQGLGSWYTATKLLEHFNVNPRQRIENLEPYEGVCKVLTGQADAMFFTAGKPIPHFERLRNLPKEYSHLLDQLHFVPLPYEKVKSLQALEPATLTPDDYSWLHSPVETVSTLAVLVSFDFSSRQNNYYKKRCADLAQLSLILKENLVTLQSSDYYHNKWKEVNFSRPINVWEYDKCSQSRGSTIKPPFESLEKENKGR